MAKSFFFHYYCIFITLKHTQSENGKVTITMTQEKAVRSHPQIPMPMSPSLAEIESVKVWAKSRKNFLFKYNIKFGEVVIWQQG